MYGALPEGAENDNGVLTIKYTRSIHGGTYTCTGKNAFNEDMVTVQLRVGGERGSKTELGYIIRVNQVPAVLTNSLVS